MLLFRQDDIVKTKSHWHEKVSYLNHRIGDKRRNISHRNIFILSDFVCHRETSLAFLAFIYVSFPLWPEGRLHLWSAQLAVVKTKFFWLSGASFWYPRGQIWCMAQHEEYFNDDSLGDWYMPYWFNCGKPCWKTKTQLITPVWYETLTQKGNLFFFFVRICIKLFTTSARRSSVTATTGPMLLRLEYVILICTTVVPRFKTHQDQADWLTTFTYKHITETIKQTGYLKCVKEAILCISPYGFTKRWTLNTPKRHPANRSS